MNRLDKKYDSIYLPLLVFIIIGIATSILAYNPVKSIFKLLPFIVGICFFHQIAEGRWSNRQLVNFIRISVIIAFIVSLIGNFEYVYLLYKGASGLALRIKSTTTHPNSLAKFLLAIIPVSITLAVISTEFKNKILYAIISLSLIASEMFTISRGAWIALVVAGLLLVIMYKNRWFFAGIIALALVGIALLPPEIGLERARSIFSLTHPWNFERVNVWTASLKIIKDHPLFGIGLNNFQYYYAAYKPAAGVEVFRHAHNTFLNLAVEMGVAAALLFIAYLIMVVKRVVAVRSNDYQQILAKSIVIGTISVLTYGMVEYNFNNELQIVLFFVMQGIALQLIKSANIKNFVK